MKAIDGKYNDTMRIVAFDTDMQKLVVIFGDDVLREAKCTGNKFVASAYLGQLSHERCWSLREDLQHIHNTMTETEFADYVSRLIERGNKGV